jgi:predicted permease
MTFTREIAVAIRRLSRTPVFAVMSLLTLSSAIALNSAVFSVVDGVLFRPLPYSSPGDLYVLRLVERGTGRELSVIPRPLLESIPTDGEAIVAIAHRGPVANVPHSSPDGAELIGTIAVAPNFLDVLGVRPYIGRSFDARDTQEPGVNVLLTHGSWRDRFGGKRDVVGQSIVISGTTRRIVGVLPPDFVFPAEGLAYPYAPAGRAHFEFLTVGRSQSKGIAVDPLVRIRPSVTRQRAEAKISAALAIMRPDAEARLLAIRPLLFPGRTDVLRVLLAGAVLVLVLGCANLAVLFLARVQERDQEIAVTLALGGTRSQAVQALLIEALALSLTAALVALFAAYAVSGLLQREIPIVLSGTAPFGVDLRVALFTVGLGVLSAVLFTLLPAWVIAQGNWHPSLLSFRSRLSARRRPNGSSAVALQVAVAVMLLILTAGAAQQLFEVMRQRLGFSPRNLLTIHVLDSSQAAPDEFYSGLVDGIASHPDVVSAGAVEGLPLSGAVPKEHLIVDTNRIPLMRVVPGYFETIGVRVLRGRSFEPQEGPSNSAVLSESAAALLFRDEDPIGKQFKSELGTSFSVVGVVNDVRLSLTPSLDACAYAVVDQAFLGRMEVLARFRDESTAASAAVRRLAGASGRSTVVLTSWWSDSIHRMTEYRTPRFQTIVLGAAGGLAMLLSAAGLAGVMSSSARWRLRELAIRIALGAQPRKVTWMLVFNICGPVAIGLCAGIVGAWVTSGLLRSQLVGFGIPEWDVTAAAVLLMSTVALVSIYLPARRVSGLSPTTILRVE